MRKDYDCKFTLLTDKTEGFFDRTRTPGSQIIPSYLTLFLVYLCDCAWVWHYFLFQCGLQGNKLSHQTQQQGFFPAEPF